MRVKILCRQGTIALSPGVSTATLGETMVSPKCLQPHLRKRCFPTVTPTRPEESGFSLLSPLVKERLGESLQELDSGNHKADQC
jgi:hypothetical protein